MPNSIQTPYDVVTVGETMIRFTPKNYERFEQSNSVEMHVGGSESNTAVGLARLGHRVCWLSRLTNNPLGRLIIQTIAAQGVDTSKIIWTDNDRIGTYYLERGTTPRPSQVFYDRCQSAMSKISLSDIPTSFFEPGASKLLHLSGITVAISPESAKVARQMVLLAKEAGWHVSFDLNYRSRLWTTEQAIEGCLPFLEQADLIFLPSRDVTSIFKIHTDCITDTCQQLQQAWPQATLILTHGGEGAVVCNGKTTVKRPAFRTNEIERLGGGDAFSAGYLSAWLEGHSLGACLLWGNAAAAIKYTLPGDLPLFDRASIEALVDQAHSTQDASIHR